MTTSESQPPTKPSGETSVQHDSLKQEKVSIFRLIRNRVIAGLFVLLPIYITYAVLNWMYDTLYQFALKPISKQLKIYWDLEKEEPSIGLSIALSGAAFFLVCAVLYVAGMFFRSRLHQLVNWILMNVPGVNWVYSAVNKIFDAISSSHQDTKQFKRVVLVPFPHSGMKAPAFVTGECQEINTGHTILCVYVPTTPVPTSGYMLLIPKEEVVELNWDLEETLQAIVSGGITVPDTVNYYADPKLTLNADSVERSQPPVDPQSGNANSQSSKKPKPSK